MYIANATGCSSIWGGSSPSTPYTVNAKGEGPAWANSLFEDNAEHGYGMYLGQEAIRNRLIAKVEAIAESDKASEEAKAAAKAAAVADNNFTTPLYLKKAALAYEAAGEAEKAKKCLETINDKYPSSIEAREAEKVVGTL
mgnify:CR=1 FL=1